MAITIDDAKTMVRRLGAALEARGIGASQSDMRELVAAQLGHRDWDTACAMLDGAAAGVGRFTEVIPILRSLDEDKCRAFYCGFLGFEVDFEHRFAPHMPLYLGLVRGPVKLHLSEHPGDSAAGAAFMVWMNGIDDYRRELAASDSGFAVPEIDEQPWAREIGLADPFGNHLWFCERPASGSALPERAAELRAS